MFTICAVSLVIGTKGNSSVQGGFEYTFLMLLLLHLRNNRDVGIIESL
jgi:hypothetical protein